MGCYEKTQLIRARYNALPSKYVCGKLIELTMYEIMKDGKVGCWRRGVVVHSPVPIQLEFYWVAPLDQPCKPIFDTPCNITGKKNTSSFLAEGYTHYFTKYDPVWLSDLVCC